MTRKYKVVKEFRLDEISAVDRPAQEPAIAAIMKRETLATKGFYVHEQERRALLDMVAGHQHSINIDVDHGETSFDNGHSHTWIRTLDGRIVIGAAEGHVHEIVEEDMTKVEAGSPEPAAASNSPSGNPTADPVGTVPNEVHMTDKNEKTVDTDQAAVAKQLEEVTKRAERAEAISELNDAQRGIFKSLEGEAADAFLAMSPEQREAEVAKAAEANAVVYTDGNGVEYRKSDDSRLVQLAKQMDGEKAKRKAQEEKAKEAELSKCASEFSHIPGNIMAILKGIDSLPEAERAEALEALKAQDAQLGEAFKSRGTSATPSSDESPLDAIAKRLRTDDPTLTPEQAMAKALSTPEGETAYAKSIGLTS